MSIIKVREYLKNYNLDNKIQEFESSSATVELAALRLNCIPDRIAKTLAFKLKDQVILIVVSGTSKIDNQKYKETFKTKASMLNFDEVESLVGHPVGGVCPFAINDNISVYLDESLKQFETVFPACGTTSSAIELTIKELELASNYKSWVNVTKEII